MHSFIPQEQDGYRETASNVKPDLSHGLPLVES